MGVELVGSIVRMLSFDSAVSAIVSRDPRIPSQAYVFLREALDFTMARHKRDNNDQERHVTGAELVHGFCDLALQQFGPMASTMMQQWQLSSPSQIGDMVYALIEQGLFGKQESDRKEDFDGVTTFGEALVRPFLPLSQQGSQVGQPS